MRHTVAGPARAAGQRAAEPRGLLRMVHGGLVRQSGKRGFVECGHILGGVKNHHVCAVRVGLE